MNTHASNDEIPYSAVRESALLASLMAGWADTQPDQTALVFLADGESETESLTYAQLHHRARLAAQSLKQRGLTGERVLLLFPSGIDYVVAFLGCLYAGVIAVPAYPPKQNWHARRLASIALDATAMAVLAPDEVKDDIQAAMSSLDCGVQAYVGIGQLLSETEASSPGWINDQVRPQDLAYLQYTSGSTGTPKGVMVLQSNLVANCQIYSKELGVGHGDSFVSWLPIFHDMGLVQGISLPLVLGGSVAFMPPAAFVQKPLRWLQAIDRYKAVFTGAPNFAFELCANRISSEEAATLDLSSWAVALNGAEPLMQSTLNKFCDRFAVSGVTPAIFSGGYGMAESTLYITCGRRAEVAPILTVKKTALEQDRIEFVGPSETTGNLTYVSSGWVIEDTAVRIVSPYTLTECGPREVGEIWATGSSICQGYWKRPQESDDMFGARLAGHPGVNFLRTGDLGFVHEGQLYVTGRLKDLIIIRGANHYPQDIEHIVETVDPSLRKGGWNAAFLLNPDDPQASHPLVVVQEVERTALRKIDCQAVGRLMADALAAEHGIDLDMVVFVPPASVPKTSSGKIQRRTCRQRLQDGELQEVGRWERPTARTSGQQTDTGRTRRELEAWLTELVSQLSGRPIDQVPRQQPFSSLGLDSMKLVEFTAEIGRVMHLPLPPSVAFEYPTVELLAQHLAGSTETRSAAAPASEPIAIIGMDCRFPKANGIDGYWQLLTQGLSGISAVSTERGELTGYQAASDAPYRHAGFIDEVDCFDAAVFNISAREAQSMDPQQRLLLETAWHALEHAGLAPTNLAGSATGVFVGISTNDYFRSLAQGSDLNAYAGTGGAMSIAANRISYSLGLQGPSLAIDTACSSSLVAIHQACASLARGESNLALAGGVNLILSTDYGQIFTQANMLAPDGQCKTFDASANGYVRGEGCGMLVLKRLSDAKRDGDAVQAVIIGSAVNQDGYSNGLTAPNGLAQQRVIRTALERAQVPASSIGYVETHGTGTPLGDPIEVRSLRAVYDAPNASATGDPCWLGAVKTNIGHLESAAGVAGLIKAALVLQRGTLPANRNFETLNPHIDLQGSRLQVATAPTDWPRNGQPRRAAVSSFGFGGTNAHIVLQEFVAETPARHDDTGSNHRPYLLTLSAKSESSLRQLAQAYAQRAEALTAAAVHGLCRMANSGRAKLEERLALSAESAGELVEALRIFADAGFAPSGVSTRGRAGETPRLAWLFTGQGSQHIGMGRDLYQREPAFRACLDRCNDILQPLLGAALPELLFEAPTPERSASLDDTRYAQPAIVALEISLAALWTDWGVQPEWVCGHSVGEYAAAYVAGVMDLNTALTLVTHRARLMASAPGRGTMASVQADLDTIRAALGADLNGLDVAAHNGPEQIVLSGSVEAVDAAVKTLAARDLRCTPLTVSHAFHSRLMDPVLTGFAEQLGKAQLRTPAIPMVSTGGHSDADVTQPDYWVQQIRQPVHFMQALQRLDQLGADTFIELGPMPILSGLGPRSLDGKQWIRSLSAAASEAQCMRAAAGALYTCGGDLRFKQIDADAPAVPAPLYPFERARHWFTASRHATRGLSHAANSSFVGTPVDLASDSLIAFETALPGRHWAFLHDHRVMDSTILPAAASVVLALQAATKIQPDGVGGAVGQIEITDLRFERPVRLADGDTLIQTLAIREPREPSEWTLRVASKQEDGSWQSCASGRAKRVNVAAHPAPIAPSIAPSFASGARPTELLADFYPDWQSLGLDYGPAFQGVIEVRRVGDGVDAWLELPDAIESTSASFQDSVHPALLDAAFQTLGALLMDQARVNDRVPLPVGMASLRLHAPVPSGLLRVRAELTSNDDRHAVANLQLYAPDGTPLATIAGLELGWLPRNVWANAAPVPAPVGYTTEWQAVAELDLDLADPADAAAAAQRSWLVWSPPVESLAILQMVIEGAGVPVHALPFNASTSALPSQLNEMLAIHQPVGMLIVLPDAPSQATTRAALDPSTVAIDHCEHLQSLLTSLTQHVTLSEGFELLLVSQGACAVNEPRSAQTSLLPQPLSPAQAAAAGMWRSAACEYPQWNLRHIDLPVEPAARDWAALPSLLSSTETCIAIRHGVAFQPRLQPLPAAKSGSTRTGQGLRTDATYLVTGGSGALGLHAASVLIDAGARHLCLVSRHARASEAAEAAVATWNQAGIDVRLLSADISDDQAVQQMLCTLQLAGPPLRGVIHAAGISDDRPLSDIDANSWHKTMAAKARGAWLLDQHTRGLDLDFFIGFSSMASKLGSASQCNYAAANALLDTLLQQRRQAGEAALAINWGPWAGEGMANNSNLHALFARRGLSLLDVQAGQQALQDLLGSAHTQVLVAQADWSVYAAQTYPQQPGQRTRVPSLLRSLAHDTSEPLDATAAARPSLDQLADMEHGAARSAICDAFSAVLADVLKTDRAQFGEGNRLLETRLSSLGVDSLMAMEVRNRVRGWVGVDLPAHLLIGGNRIADVIELIHQKVLLRSLSQVDSHPGDDDPHADDREVMVL